MTRVHLTLALCIALFVTVLKAAEPPGQWDAVAVESLSATRGRICLNGLWKLAAGKPDETRPPEVADGVTRVPGCWKKGGLRNNYPGVEKAPVGANIEQLEAVWYVGTVTVPADWKERTVLFHVERPSMAVRVVANGTDCGIVRWPGGSADVSAVAVPGQPLTLAILSTGGVMADPGEELNDQMIEAGGPRKKGPLAAGILGEVWLESRPKGAHVADVFVQTSTRTRTLALDVELNGVAQAGEATLLAKLLNEKGEEERRFETRVAVAAQERQNVRAEWKWENPRLWDLGQPNLYTLLLEVRAPGLTDEVRERFGFREFRVEGKRFLLNETEIRLRPMLANVQGDLVLDRALIEGARDVGYNTSYLWPFNVDEPGTALWDDLFYEQADAQGWLVIGRLPHMARFIGGRGFSQSETFKPESIEWERNNGRERWDKYVQSWMRGRRNHPSVVMWTTTGNYFRDDLMSTPQFLGRPGHNDAYPGYVAREKCGKEALDIIRRYDPTRFVFPHHSAYIVPLTTVNMYLNFIPLQEREEWLSHHVEHGQFPLLMSEFGTPLSNSFVRNRKGPGAMESEPLVTEYAATYFGRYAYAMETDAYRTALVERYRGPDRWESFHNTPHLEQALPFQAIQELFIRNTWRSWRALGIAGGMLPWADAHGWNRFLPEMAERLPVPPPPQGARGPSLRWHFRRDRFIYRDEGGPTLPAGKALATYNNRTLAWITVGRGPSLVDRVTAKDHLYIAGSTLNTSVALINDTRRPLTYSGKTHFLLSQNTHIVAEGEDKASALVVAIKGELAPGEIKLEPAPIPLLTIGEWSVKLVVKVGDDTHTDEFPLRIFPEPQPLNQRVAVYDPAGATTALLKSLGCTVEPWTKETRAELYVIGRRALEGPNAALPRPLSEILAEGGRVLLMAQDPQWLRDRFGWRVSRHVTRRAFIVNRQHPLFKDLIDDDLRDWRGAGTLVEAYPDYPKTGVGRIVAGYPEWGWHWGNRGSVASAAVEKPHRSAWRPLLECEFDLAFTPLMELDYAKGRVIYCGLDFEDRLITPDPKDRDGAALTLAHRLITYAATAPLSPTVFAAFCEGDKSANATLNSLGVDYREIDRARLLVLGDLKDDNVAQARAFAENGGRVLVLPRREAKGAFGLTLTEYPQTLGSLAVPDWTEANGLSVSDLRWRAPASAWLFDQEQANGAEVDARGQLARMKVGKGVIIACQFDPDRFKADELTYFRLTRWRQTRALYQVLANLGATFTTDQAWVAAMDVPRRFALAGPWRAKLTAPAAPEAKPLPDPGISAAAKEAVKPETDDTAWTTIDLPNKWETLGGDWAQANGEAVFRRTITIPDALGLPRHNHGYKLRLVLSAVDDHATVFFNGEEIGTIKGEEGRATLTVPGHLVRTGRAVIAVRVWDASANGGLVGRPDEMRLDVQSEDPYHPDYRHEFFLGDDPFRYHKW